ncbi:MAG: nucleotidyltransferase domain-containing protein [Ignavibacteriaceae bacterium]
MIFNKTLNSIFSSSSHVAVLRSLQHYKIGITGREIARLSGLSPKSALSALSSLENIKIVNRVIGGRDHLFTLNRENYLVKYGILPLFQIENKFLPQLLTLIKQKLSKHCISIVLFGSVARNNETIESDLDICFVVQNKKSQKNIVPIIHALQDRIFTEFGTSLAPIYFTIDEFRKRAAKNLSPVNNIIKEGILISGKPIRILAHGS